ncbi:DNA-binding protein [Tyzzerella sp. OttesenSCG-928-J15]|nr:DNA-binding protein [Tyzzerella sp. OttesenSCG-928-J15]
MEYKKFKDTIIARIDPGEEILDSLKKLSLKENIKLASINALGAIGEFTVGAYDIGQKKFISTDFSGNYEIISLIGTVNTMNGEYYSHIHLCAGGVDCVAVGGHLSRGVVSNTCEMVINIIDGTLDRKVDDVTGLNIFDFSK